MLSHLDPKALAQGLSLPCIGKGVSLAPDPPIPVDVGHQRDPSFRSSSAQGQGLTENKSPLRALPHPLTWLQPAEGKWHTNSWGYAVIIRVQAKLL